MHEDNQKVLIAFSNDKTTGVSGIDLIKRKTAQQARHLDVNKNLYSLQMM